METASLESLLDAWRPAWRKDTIGSEILGRRVETDSVLFHGSRRMSIEISPLLYAKHGPTIGSMVHKNDASYPSVN